MYLRNEFWELKNIGGLIFKYSPKEYFRIYCIILKESLKLIFCLAKGK